jgi:hypothetical protein
MRVILLTVVAVAAVIAVGLVQGSWTDRWGNSAALEEAAARLDRVPWQVGDWQGKELEMDARQMARSGVARYLARRYQNRFDHTSISILLLCGRAGPVSVHTPDVCYGGAGYEMVGRPARHEVAPGTEFWVATFRAQGLTAPGYVRVWWAWSASGGGWKAAGNPRLAFGRTPALYKLYVTRELTSPEERPEDGPCVEFLRRFLTEYAAAP